MSVVVMICFARSGGTILNRCLGSLPNTVMLSEVNPLGGGWGKRGDESFVTVQEQAKNWYQIDLASDGFREAVLELEEVCEETRRYLIIRDWSFVNFVPHRDNRWSPPNRLLSLHALDQNCELVPFAFVRDSIDVWISRGTPPAETFFDSYLRYVRAVLACNLPIFKYEEFCRRPGAVIRGICDYAGLDYSDNWQEYASFDRVHGDVQIAGGSRGARKNEITLLPRKQLSVEKIAEVNRCPKMVRANELLGYPPSYYGAWPRSLLTRLDGIVTKYTGVLMDILR